jgi:outer membrane protein TolC
MARRPVSFVAKNFVARSLLPAVILALAGCAHYQPKPLSPAQSAAELEGRSLSNIALKQYLEKNLNREFSEWPPASWDFDALTLVAFYYHPDLAVARAQWHVAEAGVKTAGGRPNPTLSVTPGYNSTSHTPTPWLPSVNFDLPIETAGKRAHRIESAEQLTSSARLHVAVVAWQVRSALIASLLDYSASQQREDALQQQRSFQEQIVKLLEQQVEAGAISASDAVLPRILLQKIRLELSDAQRQRVENRARVAEALGVPLAALNGVKLPANRSNLSVPSTDLISVDARRTALQSRSDILGSLADYAAAEAALQTEIAKQYPDVHLNPGYQYDQGENKWSVGLTFELPVLNQNQGPIAEAQARREEAAAKFNALQAKVLADIERAVEIFQVSEKNSDALKTLADVQLKQRDSVEAQFKVGAVDRLDLLNSQFEWVSAQLVQLDGRSKLDQAAAQLENAVQRPFETWPALERGLTAQAKSEKP